MDTTITLSAMLTSNNCPPNGKYKVRAITAAGEQVRYIFGEDHTSFDLEVDTFSCGADIEERLIPAIAVMNSAMFYEDNRVVKLEAYYVKEVTIAEMDLDVKDMEVRTSPTDWKYVPYA